MADLGVTGPEALGQVAGLLRILAKEAAAGHIQLDAATQALIDQANASGLLDLSPQEQMAKVLDLQLQVLAGIATMFHVVLPSAVQDYISSLNQIPTVGGPGGAGPAPGGDYGGGDVPSFAAGGDVYFPYRPGGHLIRVGDAPPGESASLRTGPRSGGGGLSVTNHIYADGNTDVAAVRQAAYEGTVRAIEKGDPKLISAVSRELDGRYQRR
jgi:hypothetical protein